MLNAIHKMLEIIIALPLFSSSLLCFKVCDIFSLSRNIKTGWSWNQKEKVCDVLRALNRPVHKLYCVCFDHYKN